MKTLIQTSLLLGLVALAIPAANAQDKPNSKPKPKGWEQHKVMTLWELTEEQQRRITDAVPDTATAKPIKTRKVLMFYRCDGFVHKSIPFANFAVQEMARKTGALGDLEADDTPTASKGNPELAPAR